MKRPLIAFLALLLCAGLIAGGVVVAEWRAANLPVRWYNDQWFASHNNAPGGMTFNMGAKNYEFGVRADGVVIVREYNDANRSAAQVGAKEAPFHR